MLESLIFDLIRINNEYFPGKYGARKEIELNLGEFNKNLKLKRRLTKFKNDTSNNESNILETK
tara:strand:- start:148 stop:336 length:189 start_codon:yes stop_codon:yes gene_type:complete